MPLPRVCSLVLGALAASGVAAIDPAPLDAGGVAVAPAGRCPSGGPLPIEIHWNVLYAQVDDLSGPGTGRGEGTNLSGITGISSQAGMTAYTGGSLGGVRR